MVLSNLCFFAVDKNVGIHYADGGINAQGHNGYVKDCSSLGPDVIPQGGFRLMPKSVATKHASLRSHKAGKTVAAAELSASSPSGFYTTMQ